MPKIWKIVAIAPIPKNSSPSLGDLRPISLLPFPGIFLERMVLDSKRPLKNYGKDQYGFRPKSSTLCAFNKREPFHDKLTSFLDDRSTCVALTIAVDYSKAFDKLKHDLIINRLIACDFPNNFVRWIQSYTVYLSNRKQFTKNWYNVEHKHSRFIWGSSI